MAALTAPTPETENTPHAQLSIHSTAHEDTDLAATGLQCRSWIGEQRYGSLGCTTGRGWRSTVVNFAASDAEVVFRVPAYNEISQYAYGRRLSLKVSGRDRDRARTEVLVTGTGYLPDNAAALARNVDLAEEWPPGVVTHIVCLDLAGIRGSIHYVSHLNH